MPDANNGQDDGAVTATSTGHSFGYDAAGNMTTRTLSGQNPQTLTWDESNRLSSVSQAGSATVTYLYDADGSRVGSRTGSTTTAQIDDLFDWSSTGGLVSYYTHAGTPIGYRDAGGMHWRFGDHLGSVSTVYTPGQPVGVQRYYPYGSVRTSTGLGTGYGYTGQRSEPTGLLDYGARPYDPVTGRFSSPDTLIPQPGNPETLNRYTYVNNNPTTNTDPTGNSPCQNKYGRCIPYKTPFRWPWELGAGWSGRVFWGIVEVTPYVGDVKAGVEAVTGRDIHTHRPLSIAERLAVPVGLAIFGAGANEARRITGGAESGVRALLREVDDTGALNEAFHYTARSNISRIEIEGLSPGSYATPAGQLSPLQAQIELALVPNRLLPDARVRIDIAGLREAGYEIPAITRVSNVIRYGGRVYSMPGGGWEMNFPYAIPSQFIKAMP